MFNKTGKNCFVYGIIAFLFLLCTPVSWATDVSGVISVDKWTLAGSPYIVTGDVTVDAGKTLTIDPGVVVKFNSGFSLKVLGNLTVSGTGTGAGSVIFTSSSASPALGSWGGIRFEPGSSGSLSYAEVMYADTGIDIYGTSPLITNCTIHNNEKGFFIHDSRVTPQITHCTIRNNTRGIEVKSDYHWDTPSPVVNNCSLSGNGFNYYVSGWGWWSVKVLDARNNWWGTNDIQQIRDTIYDYTAVNSDSAAVNYSSFLNSENGSPILKSPAGETYLIGGITENTVLNSGNYRVLNYFRVQSPAELSVNAGVKIKFDSEASLIVCSGGKLTVSGTGTGASSVIFTSASASPALGNWGGIRFEPDSDGSLSYAEVMYADTGIDIWGSSPLITNCMIHNNEKGFFIHDSRVTPQITHCTIRNNTRGIEVKGFDYGNIPLPVVNQCSLSGNVSNYYVSGSGWDWDTKVLDARNNWWGSSDIQEIVKGINDYTDDNNMPMVNYSSFLSAENGSPITKAPTGETYLIGGTVENTVLSGNYIVPYSFHVSVGSELTVAAGTTIKFQPGTFLKVCGGYHGGGKLTVSGTSASPVIFTSASATPALGSWKGIMFEDNSTGSLVNAEIMYADTGIDILGSSPTITDCTIHHNNKGIYIYDRKVTPQITHCTIRNNTRGIEVKGSDYGNIPLPVVNQCSLSVNGSNYYVSGSGWDTTIILDAKNNSWGTDNVTEIAKTIFDHDDDPNLARVETTPVMILLLPDLTVSIQSVSEAYAGQPCKVTWTVNNVGNGAANGTWTDSVYISAESVLNQETAKRLGQFPNMKSLALNETYTNSATVTLDGDKTVPYYVFVVTDSGTAQAEISKDNNRSAASQVTIKDSPLSNLVAADLKVPSSASPSSDIDISWQVKNDGLWNISGTWVDSVYLRDKDNKDTLLGEFTRTEGVNANADYWLTKSVKIPTTVTPGSYSIVVKTNSNTGVPETNATDDIVVSKITIAKPKLMIATPDMISLDLTPGDPKTGQIKIGNLGTTDISGIASVIKDASANITIQFTIPAVVGSGNSQVVNYTVTANDETVLKNKPTVVFKSSNNDEAAVTFDITVIPRRPSLVVNPGFLETGILRGQQRIVRCEITNNGGAPANNLMVLMPQNVAWIKLVSPESIGTLAVGAKAGIEISLNPTADVGLGAYTGSFAVSDGANVSLNIGFRITITSDAKGGLKITAKDEFSYFAETHPNVEKATVIVTDMSGNKVAEGVTDATGIFQEKSINEGRYNLEVRADKHASFHSSVEIVPGVVKEVEAFMQRQLVSYKWSVLPVEIQDKYKVTLEAVFETNVPAPVVTVEPAFNFIPVIEGQEITINITVTNHGLIAAQGTKINFPESGSIYFEPLIRDIGILPAMTSVTVPVKIRAKQSIIATRGNSDKDECLSSCVEYYYYCGEQKTNYACIAWKVLKNLINEVIELKSLLESKLDAVNLTLTLLEKLGSNYVICSKNGKDVTAGEAVSIVKGFWSVFKDSSMCYMSSGADYLKCGSAFCGAISSYNNLSEILKDCDKVNLTPVSHTDCLCTIIPFTQYARDPNVSDAKESLEKLKKCMCGEMHTEKPPQSGSDGGGGGGGILGTIDGPVSGVWQIGNPCPCPPYCQVGNGGGGL